VLRVDDVVVTVAAVHYSTTMSLVRVLQVVVVVIECIGRAVLQEETSLSLSKTRDILFLGVWQIEIENSQVHMVQLEVGSVLVLRVAGREEVLLEAYIIRESQCETILSCGVLIKDLVNCNTNI
jgi:hypothetical protein